MGNAILGNPANAAALEIALVGPTLQAITRTGAVVLGAPVTLSSGRQRLVCNQSFTLEPGEELQIGGIRDEARTYLCVVGGFQTPEILGSRCSLAPVRRDDMLPCSESSVRARAIRLPSASLEQSIAAAFLDFNRGLRVLPGPEADWFPDAGQLYENLLRGLFTVRPESNRMGARLTGEPLPVPAREMVSQPAAPGAVQVSRDGQLIILGVDGQTIGGYPRIAHVINADLDVVGQLRPGDRVRFELVNLAEAERLGRENRAWLDHWCLRIREAASAF